MGNFLLLFSWLNLTLKITPHTMAHTEAIWTKRYWLLYFGYFKHLSVTELTTRKEKEGTFKSYCQYYNYPIIVRQVWLLTNKYNKTNIYKVITSTFRKKVTLLVPVIFNMKRVYFCIHIKHIISKTEIK